MTNYNNHLPNIVTTVTPQRISFVGGGTDFEDYFKEHGGAVVCATIDKYVYVTVKRHSPLFNENYRLSYSKTEHVNSLDEIENDIARECLRLLPVDPPLFIATAADLPASSGLGSSSSFAVGLLHALHEMRGEKVSSGQLAEEACHVEIDMLKKPIGKQDQYAAAVGGLNHIQFERNGRVNVNQLWLQNNGVDQLFDQLLLVWTGVQRESSNILHEQKDNIRQNKIPLNNISAACLEVLAIFRSNEVDFEAFGKLLDQSWQQKKMLSSSISNAHIDRLYQTAVKAGSYGGKVAGAGGGGFLLLVLPSENTSKIENALGTTNLIRIRYDPHGSRVLFKM